MTDKQMNNVMSIENGWIWLNKQMQVMHDMRMRVDKNLGSTWSPRPVLKKGSPSSRLDPTVPQKLTYTQEAQ